MYADSFICPTCGPYDKRCVPNSYCSRSFDALRSLPHLIETVTDLNARRIGLRSLTENIDTTTPGGRLIFHVFGALAAFERDLVKERTMAGLAAAAARGRQGGRRPVVTPSKLERARARTERPGSLNKAENWENGALRCPRECKTAMN
jgi:DNA invertase Pin-like site-specific DNA recombinase